MISMSNLRNTRSRGRNFMLMKKKHISGIIILLVICLMTSGCMFTKVTEGFSVNPEASYGFHIPQGSVIYHWANGITEVYGPDNKRILITKDSLVTTPVPGPPGGPFESPTTRLYHVPNGTRGDWDESTKTDRNYLDDTLILTIIEKDENYPVISVWRFYIPLP